MIRKATMELGLRVIEISENLHSKDKDRIKWRDHLAWKIEDLGTFLFTAGYAGSDEEIEDALEYSEEDWPSEHMTDRQQAARREKYATQATQS